MMRFGTRLLTFLCLGILFSSPFASDVDPDPDRCAQGEFTFCLNGVGSAVTSLDAMRISGIQASSEHDERGSGEEPAAVARRSMGTAERGFSSGDVIGGWGVWGGYRYSDFETDTRAPYDAIQHGFLAGADTMVTDQLLIGLALGYERTDTETNYNGGEQQVDGVTVAPYAAFLINEYFSVTIGGGYSHLDTDQDRLNSNNGALITSDFTSDRVFGTGTLSGTYSAGNWVFGGHVGFLYTSEDQDRYIERDSIGGAASQARNIPDRHLDLAQGSLGADVGYSLGAFEPYATVTYRNDFGRDDGAAAGGLPGAFGNPRPDDDDEYQIGLGIRYFGNQGLSGTLEWTDTNGRSQFDDTTVTANIRWEM